jgi:hypothetical protein
LRDALFIVGLFNTAYSVPNNKIHVRVSTAKQILRTADCRGSWQTDHGSASYGNGTLDTAGNWAEQRLLVNTDLNVPTPLSSLPTPGFPSHFHFSHACYVSHVPTPLSGLPTSGFPPHFHFSLACYVFHVLTSHTPTPLSGLPIPGFPSHFSLKTFVCAFISPMHATCPSLLHLMIPTIFRE